VQFASRLILAGIESKDPGAPVRAIDDAISARALSPRSPILRMAAINDAALPVAHASSSLVSMSVKFWSQVDNAAIADAGGFGYPAPGWGRRNGDLLHLAQLPPRRNAQI
jgi:hypothetical protein